MRRPVAATLGVLAVVGLVICVASPSAGATVAGTERFKGFLIATTRNGQRQVRATGLAASGVFNGRGRIVEVDNLPGDPDNVLRDDLVFGDGVMHLVTVRLDFSFDVDPRTCLATFKSVDTATIDGGTGRFAEAAGQFDGSVAGRGLIPRLADGTCDVNQGPLVELDIVAATGTLTF